MSQSIEGINREALQALQTVTDGDALNKWKSRFLGRKGEVGRLFANIGSLPQEERAAFGQQVNAMQKELNDAFERREILIQEQSLARNLEEGEIDITLPAHPRQMGGLHPSTRTHREFQAIWADMGFQVYQSFDVEEDELNFTLLNSATASSRARYAGHILYHQSQGAIANAHITRADPCHARIGRWR